MHIRTFIISLFTSCLLSVGEAMAADLLVEAESFTARGGWVLDNQSMEQMGSPYLLAHGLGIPVEDATTTGANGVSLFVGTWIRDSC